MPNKVFKIIGFIESKNIFDNDTTKLVSGKKIFWQNGQEMNQSDEYATPFIELEDGKYYGFANFDMPATCLYDGNKNRVINIPQSSTSGYAGQVGYIGVDTGNKDQW